MGDSDLDLLNLNTIASYWF